VGCLAPPIQPLPALFYPIDQFFLPSLHVFFPFLGTGLLIKRPFLSGRSIQHRPSSPFSHKCDFVFMPDVCLAFGDPNPYVVLLCALSARPILAFPPRPLPRLGLEVSMPFSLFPSISFSSPLPRCYVPRSFPRFYSFSFSFFGWCPFMKITSPGVFSPRQEF